MKAQSSHHCTRSHTKTLPVPDEKPGLQRDLRCEFLLEDQPNFTAWRQSAFLPLDTPEQAFDSLMPAEVAPDCKT